MKSWTFNFHSCVYKMVHFIHSTMTATQCHQNCHLDLGPFVVVGRYTELLFHFLYMPNSRWKKKKKKKKDPPTNPSVFLGLFVFCLFVCVFVCLFVCLFVLFHERTNKQGFFLGLSVTLEWRCTDPQWNLVLLATTVSSSCPSAIYKNVCLSTLYLFPLINALYCIDLLFCCLYRAWLRPRKLIHVCIPSTS